MLKRPLFGEYDKGETVIQPDDMLRYNNSDVAYLTNNRRNTKLNQRNTITQSFVTENVRGTRG